CEGLPAFGATTGGFAEMTGTKRIAELQRGGTFDQERSAELRTFGDEQPAQRPGLGGTSQRTADRRGYVGIQVAKIGHRLLGAAAARQVGEYSDQVRIGVQRLEFRLEQILRN